MKSYLTHFGTWLGGSLLLLFVLSFMGIYFPFLHFVALIGGTIVGIVMTQKAEGGKIKFGTAFGAIAIIVGALWLVGIIMSIVNWGTEGISFMLPFWITNLLLDLMIAISILLVVGVWYMFEKAGQPGYASIIPIYNIIVMLAIAKKPTWWLAMFFIPIANIVFLIMMFNGISKNFGKDSGFTVGLVFLGQIFFAILGYGESVYLAEVNLPGNEDVLDSLDSSDGYRQ